MAREIYPGFADSVAVLILLGKVVIGLIVTPPGFPLAYEAFSGNTSDKTTLRDFLHKIETQYGKARRIWVMDLRLLLERLKLELPAQPPPRITVASGRTEAAM